MNQTVVRIAAIVIACGWIPVVHATSLIDASRNNGGFEMMNGGVPVSAKIKGWDVASSDIDDWTQWIDVSTVSGDSGVEYNNAAASYAAFLENGNAVYNLTDYTAQAGDVFTFTFDIPSRPERAFDIGLVYRDSADGPIRVVTASIFKYNNTGLSGATYRHSYTVSAGDGMLGHAVGLGLLNPEGYPNIDNVTLVVQEQGGLPPELLPSVADGVFRIHIDNLVAERTYTLVGSDHLAGDGWELAEVMAPIGSTVVWESDLSANPKQMFYKIGPPKPMDAIRSGVGWYDNNGDPVSAHGANIIKDGDLYYLFGEYKSDSGNAFNGFSCYSSPDLYNWTFENIVLPVQASGRLGPDRVGERPKVMKCPTTGEYVMYMHTDSLGYTDQAVGYATCDTIDGDYTFQGPLMYGSSQINLWDMGVFQDDDGTGYLVTHGGNLYQLSSDYRSIVEQTVSGAFGQCESPAIFKDNGRYYWIGSGLTGWERNDNYYYTATDLGGPWTYRGYIAPVGTLTWNSQSSFVLTVTGSEATTHMYMGDRWSHPYQRSAATYVWQPLRVENGTLSMPEYEASWNIDLETGRWYPSEVPSHRVIENTETSRIIYSAGWTEAAPEDAFQDTRSDVAGASFSVDFEGTRIGIYGVGLPDGGYARAEIKDGTGTTILSRVFETYCKYPESSLKFLSPVLERGTYKLVVTVLGEHWSWTLKNGTVTGSTGDYVSIDQIVVNE